MLGKRIAHSLNPLAEITVLKYETIKFVLFWIFGVFRQCLKSSECIRRRYIGAALLPFFLHHAPCGAEIMHAIAWRRIRNAVIQCLPLIRNHLPAHQLLLPVPKCIRDSHLL